MHTLIEIMLGITLGLIVAAGMLHDRTFVIIGMCLLALCLFAGFLLPDTDTVYPTRGRRS